MKVKIIEEESYDEAQERVQNFLDNNEIKEEDVVSISMSTTTIGFVIYYSVIIVYVD